MANTAFSERDVGGRVAGMKELETLVNTARKNGGGTREDAADALNTLLANGVDVGDSKKMLGAVVRQATAARTDANDIARIGVRLRDFGLSPDRLTQLLSGAQRAGQLGSFELNNAAKWLPQIMAPAGMAGMRGEKDYAKVLAWMQASIKTAGTPDEAGTNLKDLMALMSSEHFMGDMAKVVFNGGKKLKGGERFAAMHSMQDVYQDYQSRGIGKVEATLDLFKKVIDSDPRFASLKKRYDATKDDGEKKEILGSMMQQLTGSSLGQVFKNQQSAAAFLAIMNNQDLVKSVETAVLEQFGKKPGELEVDKSFAVREQTGEFKMEQANEAKKLAEKAAIDGVSGPLGKLADMAGATAEAFPKTTGAAVLLATALTAAAGAAAVFSIAGGKGIGGAVTGAAGALGALGPALGRVAPTLGRLSLAGGAAYGAYEMYQLGDAFTQWYSAAHRDGVALSPQAQERINGGALNGWRGKGYNDPRLFDLTAPVDAAQTMGAQSGQVQIGQGQLDINVRVTDDRVTLSPTVAQQPSLIRINPGSTNPAGYSK
ncbi:phage tail tape measure protein [Limnohabitans sp.]|uniref:phage tail tape measure protein n=1 Tax=Limnohabitans sp. TaxID=1907725 RepID=UPI00286EF67C|nr:phage tail tape measure protein [Limnohabitans sp.]